jgi:Tfp pilus assembly protein PilV
MSMRPARFRCERGFTLVEVVAAGFVLVIGVLGTIALVDGAVLRTLSTKQREGATTLTRELVEEVRSVPYGQLADNTVVSKLQAQPGLADANLGSGGWTVKRRGTSYAVSARTCSVDDPKDGVGANEGAGFCQISTDSSSCGGSVSAGGAVGGAGNSVTLCLNLGGTSVSTLCGTVGTGGSGTIGGVPGGIGTGGSASVCGSNTALDSNPDDYKLVLFDVSWNSGAKRVKQATVVANPGQGAGPAVKALVAVGLTNDTITSAGTSYSFNATTSLTPSSVQWSIDGAIQGRATGTGTAWTFNWDTSGVVDGSYVIGARAYDANGQSGISATRTITINRGPPAAPTGFVAGRNGEAMDFEWDGSPDRDVAGYKVFQKVSSGSDQVLCDLTASTDCIDTSPPSIDPIDVYVVAYDHDTAGNLRAGTPSAVRRVTSVNQAPYAPASLGASSTGGSTILTWAVPDPADPDSGDSIQFYRVYRDGHSYNDRYDEATCPSSSSTCAWTDTHTSGSQHTYYVTSVDGQLAESVAAGPVTR